MALPLNLPTVWDDAVDATNQLAVDLGVLETQVADLESRSGTSVAGIVPTFAELPTSPLPGQAFVVQDETAMYVRNNLDQWVGPVPVQGAATNAAVASAVQTPTVLNALTTNGKRPVGKGELIVNVLDHGAVGDGITDDTSALTAALTAGAEVLIPAGATLRVSDVEVNGKRITGPGIIKKASGAESALRLTGNGASVSGLTFHAESSSGQPRTDIKIGDGAKNVTITGCTFQSNHYSAVAGAPEGSPYAQRASGVQILGNKFLANPTSGAYARPVFLHSVDNATISDNIIRDCRFDGIRLRDNNGFVIVSDNQFINVGDMTATDDQTRDAIDTYYAGADLIITGNVVRGTACFGFDVKGYAPNGTGTNRVIITNNQISGCKYSGIKLFGDGDFDGAGGYKFMSNVVVSNNVISGCNWQNIAGLGSNAYAGILLTGLVSYVSITGNHVVGNYGRGIYSHNVVAGKAISHDVLIAQNMVVNNGHTAQPATAGIHVGGLDYARIESNTVVNDATMPNADRQTIGIYVHHAENGYTATPRSMTIVGNSVRGHSGAQIQTDPNNNRATGIGVFRDNMTSAVYRGAWMETRLTTYGVAAPGAGEGSFVRGDRVFRASPAVGQPQGWVCTASGTPGTWVPMPVL